MQRSSTSVPCFSGRGGGGGGGGDGEERGHVVGEGRRWVASPRGGCRQGAIRERCKLPHRVLK